MGHRASSPRKVAFASFIGTTIEFFDFGIFSTASALIFNELFFPSLDPLTGTLAAFASFGVAFLVRPLGAAVFGHFGDRFGRKRMLALSLVIMGVGTTSVGLLPTYGTIGLWAPVLLVLSRVLQGIAVSGEWSGAVLMAVEHAPARKRALYASWPQRGVPSGLVLSTASFYLVEQLPRDAMMSWGWRVPFLAGAVLVAVGLYVRLKIAESPAFRAVQERDEVSRHPTGEVFRKAGGSLTIAVFSMAANSIMFYSAAVFALNYGVTQAGASRGTMLLAVAIGAFLQIFTIPIVAGLADRHGRRPVLLAGSLLTVLVAFPFFWLVDSGEPVAVVIAMVLALSVVHALTGSPMAIFLPELFETRLRYSGSAIGYHVGAMVMSGPTPFVAAALFAWAGASWPLALYIVLGGVITAVAVWIARESYEDEIVQAGTPAADSGAHGPATVA